MLCETQVQAWHQPALTKIAWTVANNTKASKALGTAVNRTFSLCYRRVRSEHSLQIFVPILLGATARTTPNKIFTGEIPPDKEPYERSHTN